MLFQTLAVLPYGVFVCPGRATRDILVVRLLPLVNVEFVSLGDVSRTDDAGPPVQLGALPQHAGGIVGGAHVGVGSDLPVGSPHHGVSEVDVFPQPELRQFHTSQTVLGGTVTLVACLDFFQEEFPREGLEFRFPGPVAGYVVDHAETMYEIVRHLKEAGVFYVLEDFKMKGNDSYCSKISINRDL